MCGIAGIVGRPDRAAVEAMTAAMRHRGPDDSGVYSDEDVALGAARLAILDLSPAGHQPMTSDDGRYVMVYNGELYNFAEERRKLEQRGQVFRSSGDTEVVLQMYRAYGVDCVRRMNGMFSIAIWDRVEKTFFAARDHLGIKPFLYAIRDGRFIFASEIKTILASGLVPREIDPDGLGTFLSLGSVLPPHTMVAGVKSLQPGQHLVFKDGQATVGTYWDVRTTGTPRFAGSFDDARDTLRALVMEAVQMQTVSDVPYGAFLSGGVDSAIITAVMAKHERQVKTFSIGFAGEASALDESRDALTSARHFRTDHHSYLVPENEVEGQLACFVAGLDQPSVDGLNVYFVSRLARQHVTVALAGLGADELFAGYSRAWRIAHELSGSHPVRRFVGGAIRSTPGHAMLSVLPRRVRIGLQRRASRGDLLASYALSRVLFWPDELADMLDPGVARAASLTDLLAPHDDPGAGDAVRRLSCLDMKTFMGPQLLRDSDAVSMAHSLEVRVPFIDSRIVEFAYSLPGSFKCDASSPLALAGEGGFSYREGMKRLLLAAFQGELPPDLPSRRKQGFQMPIDRWLRGPLRKRMDDVLLGGEGGLPVDREALRDLHRRFHERRASWPQVWAFIVLAQWREHILRGK